MVGADAAGVAALAAQDEHAALVARPEDAAAVARLAPGVVPAPDWARLVLDAHENLVAVDEANRAKFQDVLSFLKNRLDQK